MISIDWLLRRSTCRNKNTKNISLLLVLSVALFRRSLSSPCFFFIICSTWRECISLDARFVATTRRPWSTSTLEQRWCEGSTLGQIAGFSSLTDAFFFQNATKRIRHLSSIAISHRRDELPTDRHSTSILIDTCTWKDIIHQIVLIEQNSPLLQWQFFASENSFEPIHVDATRKSTSFLLVRSLMDECFILIKSNLSGWQLRDIEKDKVRFAFNRMVKLLLIELTTNNCSQFRHYVWCVANRRTDVDACFNRRFFLQS